MKSLGFGLLGIGLLLLWGAGCDQRSTNVGKPEMPDTTVIPPIPTCCEELASCRWDLSGCRDEVRTLQAALDSCLTVTPEPPLDIESLIKCLQLCVTDPPRSPEKVRQCFFECVEEWRATGG